MPFKHVLKKTLVKAKMDAHLLGFRIYIISKMNRMLSEDARTVWKDKQSGACF